MAQNDDEITVRISHEKQPACNIQKKINKRTRHIIRQHNILKISGLFFIGFSAVCFLIGVTLMALDFDGNDDEYYEEDGEVKTRMGMFDYGVIILGVAVIFIILSVVCLGLICFLPAFNIPKLPQNAKRNRHISLEAASNTATCASSTERMQLP